MTMQFLSLNKSSKTTLATIILLAFWLCSSFAAAEMKIAPFYVEASVFKDPNHILSFDEILSQRYQTEFKAANATDLSFGYTALTHWIKLKLTVAETIESKMMLEIGHPHLDELEVYVLDKQGSLLNHYHTGDRFPFYQRPIVGVNFIFDLAGDPEKLGTIYIRTKSSGALQVPIKFHDANSYKQQQMDHIVSIGLYNGLLAAILFYNLFLLLSVKRIAYFYYVTYIGALILHESALSGIGFAYLWPNNPEVTNYMVVLTGTAIGFAVLLFSRTFLELHQSPILLKINNALLILSLGMLAACFLFPYHISVTLYLLYFSIYGLNVMILGVCRYYQGFREARFYLAGWMVLAISAIIYISVKADVLPAFYLSEHLLQLGTAWETLLLSFALGDRLNTLSEQLESANIALSNQNQLLEQKVENRTEKLSTTLKDLQKANDQLKALSKTDHLTGLYNRQHFDQVLAKEIKHKSRTNADLSLIILDIDYFKKINDSYGHIAGDSVLQEVALCLKGIVTRETDTLCRYGGEEFAIILAGTSLSGAAIFAEKIREIIENLQLEHDGNKIFISVSLGVATANDIGGFNQNELLKTADKALYQAKNQGRNQVVAV